jgi:AcrR family transcriptional regulator
MISRKARMGEMDKRGQILEVAEELFARKGYGQTTMREIAERLDMKKPSLYHHFQSKEDIYSTLILDIYRQLLDELAGLLNKGETLDEKLRLAIDRMVDFWAEHPNYPTIMAYEIAGGSELVTSGLLPDIWKPRLDGAAREFEKVSANAPGLRDLDIRLLILIVFGIPIFYFFSSQVYSALLGRDSLSPEMIENFKRELTSLVLHGLQETE